MKKKLILSIICSVSLVFGVMAKSTSSPKSKHVSSKVLGTNYHKKTTKSTASCLVVTLSCGLKGLACGETGRDIIREAYRLDGVFCD